jgi:nucleoside-diphosphate kinase
MVQAPVATVEEHYAEHKARPFFGDLVSFFTSGPVVLIALQGKKVVESARIQIGKTKPEESPAGSIRGDLAVDVGRNLIHGSDSTESAARELSLWFQEGELCDWTPAAIGWLYEKP